MNIFVLSIAFFILPMQEFDVVNSDGKKDFPDKPMTNKELSFKQDYFLIVNDGIEPLKAPGDDSGPSGAPPMKFCEKTFQALAGPIQKNNKEYYLVCRYEDNNKLVIHGWVAFESILFDFEAPLLTEGSGITRKALIINSKEWIIKNGNGNKLPVPVKGFLEKSEKNEPIRFFNIMFVYKEIHSNDPKIGHQFLLGFDPSIPNARNASGVLAGWLPANALCQWNTRQAIQWNDDNKKAGIEDLRTSVGKIFKTANDLEAFTSQPRNENIKPSGLLASEIVDKKTGFSIPWGFDQARYPILELVGNEKAINYPGFGKSVKIGMIGNFQKSDGTFVNAQEISNERARGKYIKEGMEQTYILFVIDDTSSMDAAFKKIVPECIKNVIKTVKDLNKVKVAVCFYNDFGNKDPKKDLDETVKFHEWSPLTMGLESPVIKMLKEHETKDGGDPLEQPIHGLLHGLTKASVEPPSWARKVVFVIGDMGNHLKDNLNQDIVKDSQKIADFLTPVNNSPWEFLPLQVPHPRGVVAGMQDPDYKLYKIQMDYIAELFRSRREKAIENIADIKLDKVSTITLGNYENLLSELNKRTNSYEDKKRNIIDQLENLVRGTFVPGSKFSDEVSEAFSSENINVKLLSEGGYQIFEEGWVTELDGEEKSKPQIKTMLFMERSAFDDIAAILKKVVGNYKRDDLESITSAVIQAITGERERFKNIEDVNKAVKGIKFNSELLKLLFDNGLNQRNLKNVQLAPDILAKNMLRLSYLDQLFEDIGNDQICEYEETVKALENNFKVPIWARKNSGSIIKQQRFFKPIGSNFNKGTSLEFIWLDNEKEFP